MNQREVTLTKLIQMFYRFNSPDACMSKSSSTFWNFITKTCFTGWNWRTNLFVRMVVQMNHWFSSLQFLLSWSKLKNVSNNYAELFYWVWRHFFIPILGFQVFFVFFQRPLNFSSFLHTSKCVRLEVNYASNS